MLQKTEIALVALVIVGTFGIHQYTQHATATEISDVYTTIENQETIREDVPITEEEFANIENCSAAIVGSRNRAEECMRNFYDEYTMQHGGDKAFAHLARLQKEHPNLLPGCHYISHGIGHAMLRLGGNDPFKAFTFLEQHEVFKNVITCGNGYFHGVIEELAKDTQDKDELVALLNPICSSNEIQNRGNCYHGVGHAAMIQTEYSIPDMLYICDRISSRPEDIFGCHTGGFMEHAQAHTDDVLVKDQKMSFTICDAQEPKYQAACYLEHSSHFEAFSSDPRNYTRNIGFCKQIENDINRMACIKLFAIRAVRIARYPEVREMCLNTSSRYERVMCTAVMADRIAGSADKSRATEDYHERVRAICATMNPVFAEQCAYLVYEGGKRLFYTSDADLHFSTPDELQLESKVLELL
ncbi:MAG: hypothetical protein KBE09_05725 [Candidatus Pacebacteria bacterium]|nr:hypothetical protein [Candidatus Paceibacterota bacterium]